MLCGGGGGGSKGGRGATRSGFKHGHMTHSTQTRLPHLCTKYCLFCFVLVSKNVALNILGIVIFFFRILCQRNVAQCTILPIWVADGFSILIN
jgi:hypothetical protein